MQHKYASKNASKNAHIELYNVFIFDFVISCDDGRQMNASKKTQNWAK